MLERLYKKNIKQLKQRINVPFQWGDAESIFEENIFLVCIIFYVYVTLRYVLKFIQPFVFGILQVNTNIITALNTNFLGQHKHYNSSQYQLWCVETSTSVLNKNNTPYCFFHIFRYKSQAKPNSKKNNKTIRVISLRNK